LPAPPEGFRYLPGLLGPDAQTALVAALRQVVGEAPLYRPAMPKSGRPFSVRMTNAGSHGWYADKDTGYGYIARHPQTGQPWPAIPPALLARLRFQCGANCGAHISAAAFALMDASEWDGPDRFRYGEDVDAISRATVSVTSASRAIRNSARRAATAYLKPPGQ